MCLFTKDCSNMYIWEIMNMTYTLNPVAGTHCVMKIQRYKFIHAEDSTLNNYHAFLPCCKRSKYTKVPSRGFEAGGAEAQWYELETE